MWVVIRGCMVKFVLMWFIWVICVGVVRLLCMM